MRNIRTVDLNLLVVFDALFDERSVTRAAARLAVTQSTVSGLLNRLRGTFADQLFLRTSHGITPTPRAEALAGPVKDLLANAQSLVAPAVFDPATAEVTIRICGSDYLQHAVIGPLVEVIRKAAPKIRLLVALRPGAKALADLFARGELDLCVSAREFVLRGAGETSAEGTPNFRHAIVRLRSPAGRSHRGEFYGRGRHHPEHTGQPPAGRHRGAHVSSPIRPAVERRLHCIRA
jgi:DNA-binding transcriptional LysR family regulator